LLQMPACAEDGLYLDDFDPCGSEKADTAITTSIPLSITLNPGFVLPSNPSITLAPLKAKWINPSGVVGLPISTIMS